MRKSDRFFKTILFGAIVLAAIGVVAAITFRAGTPSSTPSLPAMRLHLKGRSVLVVGATPDEVAATRRALGGLDAALFQRVAYQSEAGDSSARLLSVTVERSDPHASIESVWEALLLVGAISDRVNSSKHSTVTTYRIVYQRGPHLVEGATGTIPQVPRLRVRSASLAGLSAILHRAAIVREQIVVSRELHPLGPALAGLATLSDVRDYLGAISAPREPEVIRSSDGTYLSIRSPNGTTVARVGVATRLRRVVAWVQPSLLRKS